MTAKIYLCQPSWRLPQIFALILLLIATLLSISILNPEVASLAYLAAKFAIARPQHEVAGVLLAAANSLVLRPYVPSQHHLLASFPALGNLRSLL